MCRRMMCAACREENVRSAMMRAYARPRGPDGKQKNIPIGWWCPSCGAFTND